MQPTGAGGPPPGWYPDPAGLKAWRWWDGHGWTGYASDPSGPGRQPDHAYPEVPAYTGYQAGSFSVPSVHDRFAAELKAAPWAKRALVAYLVIIVVGLLVAWAESSTLREIVHNLRVEAATGVAQPQENQPVDLDLLSLLTLAVEAPFYVLLLTWQFQAAKTAQLLFLPARRAPGLGVGSWFIPIVNLWFPYQAIRDCLPPRDPGRRVVARMWTFFIAMLVMYGVAGVLAWVGTPIGVIFAAITLALGAGFALHGSRAVQLIADAHQRLLYPGETGQPEQMTPTSQ